MRPTVLAAASYPGPTNALVPVIKQLQEEDKVNLIVMAGYESAQAVFKEQGVEHGTPGVYGWARGFQNATTLQKFMLEQEGVDAMLLAQAEPNPKNPNTLEQQLMEAGATAGIPSVAVSDMWTPRKPYFSDPTLGADGDFAYMPTIITILDEHQRSTMLAEGFPGDRLRITGNPHFDRLPEMAAAFTDEDRARIREQIGFDRRTLIFYSANAFSWDKEAHGFDDHDVLRAVANGHSLLPNDALRRNVGVVVKVHRRAPDEDFESIPQLVEEVFNGSAVMVEKDIHPLDLIMATDATFTPFSTNATEAVLLGKPVISLQPGRIGKETNDPIIHLTGKGYIPVSYESNHTALLSHDVMRYPGYRAELVNRSSQWPIDRNATQRVTDVVYELANVR